MTETYGEPIDDAVVRNAAEEMLVVARNAHRVEVWLVVVAAVLMVLIAGFTGFNTYRLRAVNRNLTGLVTSLETNQRALQAYNEAHSTSTALNLDALLGNVRCFTDFFMVFNGALAAGVAPPDKAVLDACFKLPAPGPPPEPLPSDDKRHGKR